MPNNEKGLAWGKKVAPAFREKVGAIAKKIDANPGHLMAVLAASTERTFDPARATASKAVGLLQFTPAMAAKLDTTVDALKKMSALEQLDLVERYLLPFKGKLRTLAETYLAVLSPPAMGKPDGHVLFDEASASAQYKAHRWLDPANERRVTKAHVAAFIQKQLDAGMTGENRSD